MVHKKHKFYSKGKLIQHNRTTVQLSLMEQMKNIHRTESYNDEIDILGVSKAKIDISIDKHHFFNFSFDN